MAGTRWVRLDVEYFGNPKILRLSPVARLLHLACICWSGAHLTDGHIPAPSMHHVAGQVAAKRRHIDELLAGHLLYEIDGDFQLHDYTAMQDSRAEVERRRRQKAERIARWRARSDDV